MWFRFGQSDAWTWILESRSEASADSAASGASLAVRMFGLLVASNGASQSSPWCGFTGHLGFRDPTRGYHCFGKGSQDSSPSSGAVPLGRERKPLIGVRAWICNMLMPWPWTGGCINISEPRLHHPSMGLRDSCENLSSVVGCEGRAVATQLSPCCRALPF